MYLEVHYFMKYNGCSSLQNLPSDDNGNFPLLELFHGYLKGISLAFQLYHDGSIHPEKHEQTRCAREDVLMRP